MQVAEPHTPAAAPHTATHLGPDGINLVGRLDLERDRLVGKSLDKDLHTALEPRLVPRANLPRCSSDALHHRGVPGTHHFSGNCSPDKGTTIE